jgi:hypothetical protein
MQDTACQFIMKQIAKPSIREATVNITKPIFNPKAALISLI